MWLVEEWSIFARSVLEGLKSDSSRIYSDTEAQRARMPRGVSGYVSVELNTTSALANYATEAGGRDIVSSSVTYVCRLLAILVAQNVVRGWCSEDEERLVRDLFRGYNKLIRPVQNMTQKVDVRFGLAFVQLINVVSTQGAFLFVSVHSSGILNNDLRRPTPFTELSVDCNLLSSAEFFPVVALGQFSRCCSFQWGIRLDGRVGEVGIGIIYHNMAASNHIA
uniref:Neurotransmitter-gated ion-channel ligand-binding domain-containing protein n=1 Tax=Timema shepardi TaxID=629360 RepID=A0A7R9FWJ5_TIMSH|nr:unnamed protein product [Timema shepardi]